MTAVNTIESIENASPGATAALLADVDALAGADVGTLIERAVATVGGPVGFATGFGVEGCVLIHQLAELGAPVEIFTVDTGYLFPETRALWARLEARYGLSIRSVLPSRTVAEQDAALGPGLHARDPDRCCRLRKVEPLRRALAPYAAWMTAIRRSQSPTRAAAVEVERDPTFGKLKLNPLVRWSDDDVWDFVRRHDVPHNPLHHDGYPSIGCAPCTTRVAPGEDPRAGRWRGRGKTECGIHPSHPAVRLQVLQGGGE